MLSKTTSLGQYLRELRMEKGKTLHEVSKGVDIDSPLLSKIERSERLPTLQQVKRLSRFYKITETSLKIKMAAEKIVKDYGLNATTYDAIKLVEEQLVEYGKKPSNT
ncbi:MAG: helix-turn-helix transcriptional regulator [Ferruginibacter sp.]